MGTPKIQALPAEAERRAGVACPHHQDQSRALRALAASTYETTGHREPDELRGSRPVLGERGGEIPPRHSTRPFYDKSYPVGLGAVTAEAPCTNDNQFF